jgi:hypothetical protein
MMAATRSPRDNAPSDVAERATQHRRQIALLLPVVGYVPGDFELLAYLHHRAAGRACGERTTTARG